MARRIDRLARRAHRHHRFAHHPLCAAYAGEVLTLGRWHLCRGCTFLVLGGLLGLVAGALVRPGALVAWGVFGLGAALGVLALALRLPKSVGRLVPAGLAGLAVWGSWLHLAGVAVAVAAVWVAYRRRGPHRSPCDTCPERSADTTCSGFCHLVEAERAFQAEADRLIARDET